MPTPQGINKNPPKKFSWALGGAIGPYGAPWGAMGGFWRVLCSTKKLPKSSHGAQGGPRATYDQRPRGPPGKRRKSEKRNFRSKNGPKMKTNFEIKLRPLGDPKLYLKNKFYMVFKPAAPLQGTPGAPHGPPHPGPPRGRRQPRKRLNPAAQALACSYGSVR